MGWWVGCLVGGWWVGGCWLVGWWVRWWVGRLGGLLVGWWLVLPLRCFSVDCSPPFENYYMPKGRNPANTCNPLHLGKIYILQKKIATLRFMFEDHCYSSADTSRYMVCGSIYHHQRRLVMKWCYRIEMSKRPSPINFYNSFLLRHVWVSLVFFLLGISFC